MPNEGGESTRWMAMEHGHIGSDSGSDSGSSVALAMGLVITEELR